VYIEKDPEEGGYIVSCPAIKGCHSQGESMDEALANIREAISGCLKSMNARAN
jgi:predicted RNase H-like HicB family nuclease